MTTLHPETCRAARALVDWTQEDLAKAAGVCRSTVRDFEKGKHTLQRSSEAAMLEAFATVGVEIQFWDDGAKGVRLRT